MDIRRFWPNISNEEIRILQSLGLNNYEWLILRRLYNGGRIGGCEISADDLPQGVPIDKIGKAKAAIKSLEKKQILVKKPKPTTIIYQTPTDFFSNSVATSFLEKVTADEELRSCLINEKLELHLISETLTKIVSRTLNHKNDVTGYVINASETKAFDGELGLNLVITFKCPNGSSFDAEFEITHPIDVSALTSDIRCVCGYHHHCTASGMVISTYSD